MFLFLLSFMDTEVSNSALVQWLERRNHNPNVVGSTPTLATRVLLLLQRPLGVLALKGISFVYIEYHYRFLYLHKKISFPQACFLIRRYTSSVLLCVYANMHFSRPLRFLALSHN